VTGAVDVAQELAMPGDLARGALGLTERGMEIDASRRAETTVASATMLFKKMCGSSSGLS